MFVPVRDDGVGFVLADVQESLPGHLGLMSMRERAELAGEVAVLPVRTRSWSPGFRQSCVTGCCFRGKGALLEVR